MRFPFSLLGLTAQILFQSPHQDTTSIMASKSEFSFKQGADIFTPKDLVELARPGPGIANLPGDLALISYSKYSFQEKK
jgi:hypothetical protein